LDRASATARLDGRPHERNSRRQIIKDELIRHTKHLVPEANEIPIPPGIRGALPSVDDVPAYAYAFGRTNN
jgi:hypothetical protein